MVMPILSKPVVRPHRVDPSKCVDLELAPEHLEHVILDLIFGANYNDPAPFRPPGYRQVMRSGRAKGRR